MLTDLEKKHLAQSWLLLQKILNRPDVRQRMLAANLDPMPLDPAAFGELVKQQLAAWGKKVREAGIEPE